jgi:hypothetical protein
MLFRVPARSLAPAPVAALVLASIGTVAPPASGADPRAPIAAKRLVPMAGPKAQIEGWKRELCGRPELGCADAPESLALYRAAGDPPDAAWGIVSGSPALVKLRGRGGAWTVERTWDFSDYPHSETSRGCGNEASTRIYPALYPVGPAYWAVALLADICDGFAGGGASYAFADIVVLGDADAPVVALYRGLPFSCSKDLRACFTEEEYRRKGAKCRDVHRGFLTLQYAPSASPARYTWTAVWHEEEDGRRSTVPLPPAGGDVSCRFAGAAICDGGPVVSPDDDGCP